MASVHPLHDLLDGINASAKFQSSAEELDTLRKENRELRELVVQLSALIMRNVVDPKNGRVEPSKR
jgi:hypothetical protein